MAPYIFPMMKNKCRKGTTYFVAGALASILHAITKNKDESFAADLHTKYEGRNIPTTSWLRFIVQLINASPCLELCWFVVLNSKHKNQRTLNQQHNKSSAEVLTQLVFRFPSQSLRIVLALTQSDKCN